MVDYLLNWLYNLMVTLATMSGIGLLAYVGLREFYPDTISTVLQSLETASFWISGINLWPVLAVALMFFVLGLTLPQRESHI